MARFWPKQGQVGCSKTSPFTHVEEGTPMKVLRFAVLAFFSAAVFAQPASAAPPVALLEATAAASSLVRQGVPLKEVVSEPVARVVCEVAAGLVGTARLTASAVLALGAIVLAIVVGVWQFGEPNHAAASEASTTPVTTACTAAP